MARFINPQNYVTSTNTTPFDLIQNLQENPVEKYFLPQTQAYMLPAAVGKVQMPLTTLDSILDPTSWSPSRNEIESDDEYQSKATIQMGGFGAGWLGEDTATDAIKRATLGYAYGPYFKLPENSAMWNQLDYEKTISNAQLELKKEQEAIKGNKSAPRQVMFQGKMTNVLDIPNLPTQEEYNKQIEDLEINTNAAAWVFSTKANAKKTGLPVVGYLVDLFYGSQDSIDSTKAGKIPLTLAHVTDVVDVETPSGIVKLSEDLYKHLAVSEPNFDGASWFEHLPLAPDIRLTLARKGITPMSFVGSVGSNEAKFRLLTTVSKTTLAEEIDQYKKNEQTIKREFASENWSRITNFGSMIISGPDTAVSLLALSAGLTVKGVSASVQGLSVAARATALGSTLGATSRAVNYVSTGYMAVQKAATAVALVDLAAYASKLNWIQRLSLTMTGAATLNLGANLKIQQSRIAWTMAGLTTEAQTEYDAAEVATAAMLGAGFGAGLFGVGVLLGAGLRALRSNRLLVVEPQEQANVVELTVKRLEGPRPIDVDGSESTAFNRGSILPNNKMYSEGSGIRDSTNIPPGPRPSEPNVNTKRGTQTQEPLSTRETIDGVVSESNVVNRGRLLPESKPDTLNPIEIAAVRANQTSERASLAKNSEDNTVSSAPESATFARATGETNEAYAARLIAADQVDGVGDLIRLVTTDEERMALSGTTLTPLEKINKLKEYFTRATELVNTLAKEVPDGSNHWFKAQLKRLKLAEDNLVIEEFKATRTKEEQDGIALTPNEKQASVGEVAAPKRSVNIPKLDPKQTKLAKAAYKNIEVARSVSETHAKLIDYLTAKLEKTGLSSSHITESLRMLAAVVANMKLDPTRVTGFIKSSGAVPDLAYSTPMGQLFVNINRMVEKNTTNMGKVEVTKLSMDIAVTVAHEIGHIFSHFLDPAEQLKIYYLYAETVDLDTAFRIENGLYNVANVSEFFANAYQAGVVAQTVEALSTPNSNIAITIGKALLNMLKTVVSALTPKDITAINVILKMVDKLDKSITKLKHTVRGRVVLARALQKTLLASIKNKKVSTLREHISDIAKRLERENLPANLVSRLEKISSDKTLKANVIKEQVFNLVMGIENFSTENLISVIKALGGTEKKIVVNIPFALDLLEKHVSDFNFKKTEVNNIALTMLLLPDSINEIISSISLLETVDPSISMSTNFANLIDIQSRYKLTAFMSALPDMVNIIIDDVRNFSWLGKEQGVSAIDAFALGFKKAQQYKITNPNKIEPISSKDASDYLANDSIGQFVGQSLNGNERGELFIDDMLTLVHQTYGISFDSVLRIEDAFNDPTIPQARRNFITKLLSDDTIPHPFLSEKDVIKDSKIGGDLHLAIQATWKEQGNVYNVTDEMFQANLKKLMPVIAKEALQLKSYKAIAFRAVQLALDESILDSISVYNASRISKKNTVFTKRIATQGEIDVKITEKFTVLEEQLKQLKGNVAAARTIMATADADVLAQFEWITGPEFIGEVNKILKLQEADLKVLQDNFTTPEALLESLDNSLLQGIDGVSSQLQFNSILQTIIPVEIRPAVKKKTTAIRKKATPNISIVKAPTGSKGTTPVVKEDIVSILAKTYSPSELMLAKLQDPAYLGKVVSYVKKTMGVHDAEDMVQKLFIDLLENAGHYNKTFPDITSASKLGSIITHAVKRIKSNESKKGLIVSTPKLDAEGMPVRNEQGKIEYTKQKRDVKDVDNVNAVATDTSFTNLDTNENDLMMFAVSENIIPVSATVKADLLVILSDKRSGNVSNLGDGTGVPNSTRVATVVRSYRKALDKFKKENDITTQEDLIEALATLHSKKTAKKTIPASAIERKSVTSAEMNKARDLSIQKVNAEQDAKNALNNEPSKLLVAIPVAAGKSQALNTTLAADSTVVPAGTLLVEGTVAVSPAANKAVLIATLDANRKSLVLTPIVEAPLEGNYRPNVISWSKNYFGNRKSSDGSLVWQNFVKWFGDSKVVDADGNPMVVYHGTSVDKDFLEFQASTNGMYGKGIYFTTSPEVAQGFIYTGVSNNIIGGVRIIPAFISIKNPFVTNVEHIYRMFRDTIVKNLGITDEKFALRMKQVRESDMLASSDSPLSATETILLQEAGFDGIQIIHTKGYSYFIAFEPPQIKSSIANSGEFSLTNPNILDANRKSLVLTPVTTKVPLENNYRPTIVSWAQKTFGDSKAPNGSLVWENFVIWFGDSQVVDADGNPMVVYHGTRNRFEIFNALDDNRLNYFSTDPDFSKKYAASKMTDESFKPAPDMQKRIDNARSLSTKLEESLYEELKSKYNGNADDITSKDYQEILEKKQELQRSLLDGQTLGEIKENLKSDDMHTPVIVLDLYMKASNIFDPTTMWKEFIPVFENIYKKARDRELTNATRYNKEHPINENSSIEEILNATYQVSFKPNEPLISETALQLIKSGAYQLWEGPEIINAVFKKYDAIKLLESDKTGLTTIAVRDAWRVKSASANTGEFSTTDSNILESNNGKRKTLITLLENTHDSVFTKLGLSKENVVSSVKDSNYPHDVLTRILQTKGIQSYEITSGDNNLVFITSDNAATITSVVDLTPTLSQEARPVTAPSKELAVRQESNLEREVLPQDESGNAITEPVLKEIESDAPVLTPTEKFISEELTNVDGLREYGMDPSFSKLLLHRFHKAIGFTESVLNTVDSIPPEFHSILAMFKGYYIAIANSNKKNYGALYPTLQKKFWLSYDQATVREMERRGDKLKGNLPVKKTQEIITEATTEVNKQIEAYNKAHKTKLLPFHAPPTPNDFELTFREQDVIPTGIKLRDKSKGLAAFRKAKLKPLTVEGAYAQSKFTPTAPASPPVPPTAPPAPPSPPTPPPTQTSAATSPPPPPSTSAAPPAQPSSPAQPAPASPAQPALGSAASKTPTPPALKAILSKYAVGLTPDNTMVAREMNFVTALFGGSEREGAGRFKTLLNNLADLADLSTHEGRLKRSQINILRRCASFCENSSLMTHHLIAGGKKAFQSFESCNSQVFQEMTSMINAHKQFDRVLKQSFRRRALVEVKKEIETILIRASVLQRGVLNDADIVSALTARNPNLSRASINNIVTAAKNLRNTSISKYAFITHLENLTGWHSLRDSAGVQFNPAEYFSYTLQGQMMTPPMRQNWLSAATRARTRSLNTAPTLDTFVMWSMGWLERRTDTRFEGAFTGLSSTTVQTNVFDSITLHNLEVTGPNSRFPAGTNVDNIPLMREASATHFTAIDPATGEVVVYRVPTAKTDLSAADLFKYNETLNGSSAHFSPAFSSSVNPNSNVIRVMMGEVLSFKLDEGRYAYSTSGSTPRFSMYRGKTRMGLSIPALTWSEIFSEIDLTTPMRTDHLITHKNFTLKRGFELLVQHQIDRELGVTGVRPSVFFDGLREAALPLANGNRTLANHIEDGFDRIAYDYATYANNLPRLRPGTVGMLRQSGTSIIRIAKSSAWGIRSTAEPILVLSKSLPELGVTQTIKNLGTLLKVYFYRPLTTESRTEITDTIFGIREYLQGARQQYLDDLDPDNPNLLEGLFGRIRRRNREQGMVGQGLEVAANLVSEIGSARNNTIFGRILSIQSNGSRLSRYILSGAARRFLNAYTPSVRAQMETLKQAGLTDARAAGNLSRMFKNIARQNGFSDWGDAATFNRFALLEKDTLDALEFIMFRVDALVNGTNRGRIIGISELKRFVDEYCNNPLTGPIPKEQIKSAYAAYVHALEVLSYTQDAISESRGLNRAPTASEGQMFIRNLIGWSQSFFSNVMKNTHNRPALKSFGVLLFFAALTYVSELLIERLHGRTWEDITEELGDSSTVIFRIASSLPWGGGLMSGMATGALAGLSELLGGTFQGYGNPIIPPAISGLGSTAKQVTTMVRDLATKDLDTPEKIAVIIKGTPGISGIVNTSPFTIPQRILLENNMLRDAPALEKILEMQEWRNANKYTNRASSSSSYPNVKAQSKLDRDRELARMQAKYRQDTEEAAKLAIKQKTPAKQKFNKDNELPKQPMSQPMSQPKVNSGVSSLLGNLL